MSTVHQSDHANRRVPARGVIASLRRVYRTVVPEKARPSPKRAWLFISDHKRYLAARDRHRVNVEEWNRKEEFFKRAFRLLTINRISGDYLEFGAGWGNSFTRAYHCARRVDHPARFWAFDSFEGFPASNDPRDSHPDWFAGFCTVPAARFLKACEKARIPSDRLEVVPGFFSDTLSPSAPHYDRLPKDIALAYVGGAFYTSAKSALDFLAPRLKHGMILAFDTYFCLSSDALAGERLAFLELQKQVPQFNFVPYIQFGWSGISFIVENQSLFPI